MAAVGCMVDSDRICRKLQGGTRTILPKWRDFYL